MKISIPQISKQIYKEDILNVLLKRYPTLGPIWVSNQIEWFNGIYSCFKDHNKFLIIIFLTKKTLDFYSRNFTKLTYDEFFSRQTIEIEKFQVAEISNELQIPKESARRKILELEKEGVIRRVNKKIVIDRSCFNYSKPVNTIKRVSTFLSVLSTICYEEKILSKKLTSAELELIIKSNFSYIWSYYYELQIPMMTNYKKIFKDLDTFHIFATCIVSQHLYAKKISKSYVNREEFIKSIFTAKEMQGINAMSISDITGIPRATVIRKLQKLVKLKNLSIDKKKHYRMTEKLLTNILPVHKNNFVRLANFTTKIFSLSILQKY